MKYIFDNVAVGVYSRPLSSDPHEYVELNPVHDGEVFYGRYGRIELSVHEAERLAAVLIDECQRIRKS